MAKPRGPRRRGAPGFRRTRTTVAAGRGRMGGVRQLDGGGRKPELGLAFGLLGGTVAGCVITDRSLEECNWSLVGVSIAIWILFMALRVNTVRKLTPLHRPKIDPPPGATGRTAWSPRRGPHLLGVREAASAATLALDGPGFGHSGPPAAVGRLATRRGAEPSGRAGLGEAVEALDGDDGLGPAALAAGDLPGGPLRSVTHSLSHCRHRAPCPGLGP